MTRIWLAAAAAAFACLAAPQTASAAMSVFGNSAAHECYEAAVEGRQDRGAMASCDSAIDQEPLTFHDRAATYVNRGVLRLHRREFDGALADFDASLRMMPDLGEAHVDRGAALIMLRDYAGAITAITHGLELGTEDPQEAYLNRGLAHEFSGDIRAAYSDYRRAAEIAPDWPRPQLELARFQVRSAAQ